METLHHGHDRAALLVVEARRQGGVEPLIDRVPGRVGVRIVGLDRVINDDVAAATRQRAADRGCETPTAGRRLEVVRGGARTVDTRAREQVVVPAGLHDRPAIARMLRRKFNRIADAHEVEHLIIAKPPCYPRHRDHD